jgi:hypothetical protein
LSPPALNLVRHPKDQHPGMVPAFVNVPWAAALGPAELRACGPVDYRERH